MKNYEKYKTVQDRADAFERSAYYRNSTGFYKPADLFAWLDLEAEEEKPLPCPFCGCDIVNFGYSSSAVQIECHCCGYSSELCKDSEHAIVKHNRVARAVIENGENEKDKKELTPHDSSARERRPEFVKMEEEFGFASRHGTEVGDDPVFDELYDYAAKLRTENSKYKETK